MKLCSIVASNDKETLKELIKLNQHRGNFSYSYTEIDNLKPQNQVKGFGEFPFEIIRDQNYKIAHVQAPTGGIIEDYNRIHPTEYKGTFLWHNGILTPKGVEFCQKKLQTDEEFDTLLLHRMIYYYGFDILSDIEGLFSCVYLGHEENTDVSDKCIYIFRTKHGKLYIDSDINISSERFDNSKCINSDIVYCVDIYNKKIKEISYFKTKRFNFIVHGEI